MCGRLTREKTPDDDDFSERHRLSGRDLDQLKLGLTWNATPGMLLPVVVEGSSRQPHVRPMRWGLLQRNGDGPNPINARAETLLQKPMFRMPFRRTRCLIPATGWYEWKTEGGRRRPWYLTTTDHALFTLAGLYDAWRDEDGEIVASYCIITTRPADTIAHVHDRMPVILRPEDEARWLDRSQRDPRTLLPLLRPYAPDRLTCHPVGPMVGNPANDGPELIAPIGEKEQVATGPTQLALLV